MGYVPERPEDRWHRLSPEEQAEREQLLAYLARDPELHRYAIESFHAAGDRIPVGRYVTGREYGRYGTPGWSGMYQQGSGAWKPRPTAQEAAWKCLLWTGRTGIPALRVVDRETGRVVWCWGSARDFAGGAGPWVLPDWHPRVWAAAATAGTPWQEVVNKVLTDG